MTRGQLGFSPALWRAETFVDNIIHHITLYHASWLRYDQTREYSHNVQCAAIVSNRLIVHMAQTSKDVATGAR